ncbi:uncharacterized protein LOC132277428 [Cornus florida]|uniref:uncharacterized protein LOC132277428 n=1 Tax=Cornus florida TaxID=4283 RepID=UPI002898CA9C|nr:uncharacterized protein LOC132277428 [Cornus florida]
MTKRPFTAKGHRAKEVLESVHTDVCGPMNIKARGGYEYFITFTNDYSRYGYIYLMHRKSEAFDKFKDFRAESERQTGKLEKMGPRSDVYLFVGYLKGTKGYSFYDPKEQKVFISTNAIFLEDDYIMNHHPRSKVVLKELIDTPINQGVDITFVPNETPDTIDPEPLTIPEPRRSGRVIRPPDKLTLLGESYEMIPEVQDPSSYEQAMNDYDLGLW